MKRWYDLNGLRLTVDTETPDLIAPIEQYVAPFAIAAFDIATYSISIGRGPLDEPPDCAEIVFEGDDAPGNPSRMAVDDKHHWLLMPGRLSIASDLGTRVTKIRISEACDRPLANLAGIHAIDVALAASGQYLLHGAALALPEDASRALLIFAPSGFGKTTTALALALGDFGLIADDAIVLQPQGYRGHASSRIWGLPRALKVHRRTAELLPVITPLLGEDWDSEGEQLLQTSDLARVARTVAPVPIPIAAIAVLGERSASRHHIAPLEKAKTLIRLTQDNIRRFPRGILPDHVKRFTALGAIIATTPTFELRVGAPLASLPEVVVAGLVQQLAQGSGPHPSPKKEEKS